MSKERNFTPISLTTVGNAAGKTVIPSNARAMLAFMDAHNAPLDNLKASRDYTNKAGVRIIAIEQDDRTILADARSLSVDLA